jgi:hypothetical protein
MKYFYLAIFFSFHAFANIAVPIEGKLITNNQRFTWTWSDAKSATVIVFLSAQCPCSHSHIQHLKTLKEKYPEVKFIGIHSNVDETLSMSENYFKNLKLTFEVIQDEQAKIANIFKALKTPHAYLISKSGEILYAGGVTNSSDLGTSSAEYFLDQALNEFMQKKSITKKLTRVLGCIISRN